MLVLGLVTQVLGPWPWDPSPWPWPRPRLCRSRPRCYHALCPGLCGMEFVPLGYLFERILAVPASSAPVVTVFSISGLIIRPHRAKMSDKLLKSLVFAKCSIFS